MNKPVAAITAVVMASLLVTSACSSTVPADPIASMPAVTEVPTEEMPTPIESTSPSAAPEAFAPHAVDSTKPSKMGIKEGIQLNGKTVSSYQRPRPVDFGTGGAYSDLPGVFTFRGGPLRDDPTYGTADIVNKKFDQTPWKITTSGLRQHDGTGSWTGSGWTGQPLIVQWPDATRKVLQRDKSAKDKEGLTEAIYATLDGHIYFIDVDTGQQTRKPVALGFPFKGAGALDPRGIPVLYVGSGDYSPSGAPSHVFVVSLVDGKVLFEFGARDSFAPRGWSGMDSSPLVDAATDTLIYCGENGVIYTFHLNTKWDQSTGQLTMKPDETVKYRYTTKRSGTGKYWLGIESSPVMIGHYMIATDNAGDLMCIDINTMKMIWVQDVWDDTNDTPVVEFENGVPYIYISTSLHWTAKGSKGPMPVWKIDATTGEIVWQHNYPCYTVSGLSGGVQGTIAIGKHQDDALIYVPVARTPTSWAGKLVALDKATGKEVWAFPTANYAWSSPVVVYDPAGNGYIVYSDSSGTMYLLDALTGKQLDKYAAGSNIEASPAVYNNRLIVGTRGQRILGLNLT